MIRYSEDLNFSILVFIINLILTIFIFKFYYRKLEGIDKLFLTVFTILYYIYSGFGASYEIVPLYYSFMYTIFYFLFIYFFIYSFNYKKSSCSDQKIALVNNNSKFIIFSYILLTFLNAGYPEFNISKLLIIQEPNLQLELSDAIEFNQGPIKKIFTYLLLIIQPFYLISLIKYKNKPLALFIYLFAPIYFYYTLGGYVARSYLMPYIAIYLYVLYKYNLQLRFYIKYGTLISIPFIIIFLYRFSEVRIGHEINISLGFIDLFKILFFQESTYPILFSNIYYSDIPLKINDFFLWLLTLPIPSFLKGSQFSLEINYYFSELLTGKSKSSNGLSVFLPGNVTESYLIFGKYLFYLMPICGGLILGYLYRILSSSSYFTILKIYFIFMMVPLVTRAGLNSAIPLAINGFLAFYLFLKIKTSYS